MAGKTDDVNSLSEILMYGILQSLFHDDTWQVFGFKGRPKRGSFWNRFIDKEQICFERFIARELVIMSMTITVDSIKNYANSEWIVSLSGSVLSKIIANNDILQSFHFESFGQALAYFELGIITYLNEPQESWGKIIYKRGPKLSNEGLRIRFLKGSSLIMDPYHSILPHIVDTSKNSVCEGNYYGKVKMDKKHADEILTSVERIIKS